MGATDEMSWPSPRVTPQEDEAWQEIADRMADRIAERLSDAPDDRPLLTMRALGDRLGISERAARALVNREDGRDPRIPSVIVGDGARRVEPAAVDEYLARQRVDPSGGGAR